MDTMSEIVLSHEATLGKYIGDANMAFWNAPIDQPDHADRAIACGRDMLAQLPDINARLKAEIYLPHDLNIGIDISKGMVVVGNMGSRFRFSYSCLGDAVKIAAGLESIIKKPSIALSVAESTIKAARSGSDLIKLCTLPVRGK
ncbi:MAG: adenylate/guanylate cyclase domain-containing protein [Candidatus Puniceispirillales bacterium]